MSLISLPSSISDLLNTIVIIFLYSSVSPNNIITDKSKIEAFLPIPTFKDSIKEMHTDK